MDKTAASLAEAEQEAVLIKKYGGLPSKKHLLLQKGTSRKCFDSADWALAKHGCSPDPTVTTPQAAEALPVRLHPTSSPPLSIRSQSNLADP